MQVIAVESPRGARSPSARLLPPPMLYNMPSLPLALHSLPPSPHPFLAPLPPNPRPRSVSLPPSVPPSPSLSLCSTAPSYSSSIPSLPLALPSLPPSLPPPSIPSSLERWGDSLENTCSSCQCLDSSCVALAPLTSYMFRCLFLCHVEFFIKR